MTVRDIAADALGNFRKNGDMNQAAAIALYAILSIIPLFILTLLVIDHVFSADPDIRERLFEGIRQFIPAFSGALLTQFGQIADKKDLLGWVGIASLVWFSAMIFSAIETAMDIIFRSINPRNYIRSKLLALAMIPLGWAVGAVSVAITYIATIASVAITYIAAILARQPMLIRDEFPFLSALHGWVFLYLIPYLLTVLFFTVVYKAIPRAKIGLKSALIGSAIFAALMEVAKQFFTWYVANYTRYNVIFGSLEAVVILVIWVFYASIILLFCAEFISSYQRRDWLVIGKALLKIRNGFLKVDERLFRKFGHFYAADEYIFREGDVSQNLFYILGGRVRMEKSAGKSKKILAEMGPGEYFGEMAALIQAPRTASARTLSESHIAVISGETLRSVLRESDEVSLFMLKEFSKRIRHTNEKLEEQTRSLLRLTTTLFFLRSWPPSGDRDPLDGLSRATDREATELQEVIEELGRRGVLTLSDGRVTGFNREEAWKLLDEHVSP